MHFFLRTDEGAEKAQLFIAYMLDCSYSNISKIVNEQMVEGMPRLLNLHFISDLIVENECIKKEDFSSDGHCIVCAHVSCVLVACLIKSYQVLYPSF